MAAAGDTSNLQPPGVSASPAEPNAAAPAYRWPRGMVWVGVGVLLVGLIVAAWAIWQQGIEARYAAIRARGEPIKFVELDAAYPHPPAGEDTTHRLLTAGNMLNTSAGKAEWRRSPSSATESHQKAARGLSWSSREGFLPKMPARFEQLHKAADLGCQARFDGAASPRGVEVVLSYASPLRGACRALCLEAIVRLQSGDLPAAAQSLAAAIKLENALANEPLGVSQLIRDAIFGVAAHETKRAIATVDFSDADLGSLQDALADIDFQRSLKIAFLGERVYTDHRRGRYRGIGAKDLPTGLPEFALRLNVGRSLDSWADYIAATELPWPQMLAECRSIAHRWDSTKPQWAALADLSAPTVLGMMATSQCRAELSRRLLLVAIALERYRARHGAAPADLAALAPNSCPRFPTTRPTVRRFPTN